MNLTEENQTFINTWRETRTQGPIWFVSKFAFSFILGLMFIHLLLNFNAVTSAGITYFLEGPRVIGYAIFGFGYGFYKWSRNEKKYETALDKTAIVTYS